MPSYSSPLTVAGYLARLGRGGALRQPVQRLGHRPEFRSAAAPDRGRVLAAPPAVTFPERSGRTVWAMREGNPVASQAVPGQLAPVPGRPARRFRLASPATALLLGGLTIALLAAQWPFAGLAHLGVNSGTGG